MCILRYPHVDVYIAFYSRYIHYFIKTFQLLVSVFTNSPDVIINVRLYNTWCMFSLHKTRVTHRHDLFILFHALRFP